MTPRGEILEEARGLIEGERNQTYGSPTQNFTDTAAIWTTLLRSKLADGKVIAPRDVASLMIALKLARMTGQPKRDNWVDIAGYAGCGFEAELNSFPRSSGGTNRIISHGGYFYGVPRFLNLGDLEPPSPGRWMDNDGDYWHRGDTGLWYCENPNELPGATWEEIQSDLGYAETFPWKLVSDE